MKKSLEQVGETPEQKEGEPKKRIVSIMSGEWGDSNYELLEVPSDLDLTKENVSYNEWYKKVHVPALRNGQKSESKTFVEWLKGHGAKDADVEEFFIE